MRGSAYVQLGLGLNVLVCYLSIYVVVFVGIVVVVVVIIVIVVALSSPSPLSFSLVLSSSSPSLSVSSSFNHNRYHQSLSLSISIILITKHIGFTTLLSSSLGRHPHQTLFVGPRASVAGARDSDDIVRQLSYQRLASQGPLGSKGGNHVMFPGKGVNLLVMFYWGLRCFL